MDAHPRSLKVIFEAQSQYTVPLFQRPYVWTRAGQWEALWDDVRAAAERQMAGDITHPHFMGAVVLEQISVPTGMLDCRQIIDGQQRLVTLQLLIAAARDVCQAYDGAAGQFREYLEFLTFNHGMMDDPDDIFKVWPTNTDRNDFRLVIGACSHQKVCQQLGIQVTAEQVGRSIPDAYLYFSSAIAAWTSTPDDKERSARLDALVKAIYKGLVLVVIDLDEKDDAQMIFETLNARGTPLLAADLVKNYLLHLAQVRHQPIEPLYYTHWRPFDEDKFWREKVPQGRLYRPRMDVYLQHYLTLTTEAEVPAGSLFATFKSFAAKDGISPGEHMASLRRYGDIFKSFYAQTRKTRAGLFFRRVETLDTTTVFPLLLYVADKLQGPFHIQEWETVLKDLESFLIRRMVCGLTTKNYNRLFLDCKTYLNGKDNFIPAALREFLASKQGDSDRWPGDDDFLAAWLSEPLYTRITRARLWMLLEALEMALRTAKTEDVDLPRTLTIEHLMPQSWEQHWDPPEDKPDAVQMRNKLLHTIGNLTLITGSLNSTLSNDAWMGKDGSLGKRAILDNHSVRFCWRNHRGAKAANVDVLVELRPAPVR